MRSLPVNRSWSGGSPTRWSVDLRESSDRSDVIKDEPEEGNFRKIDEMPTVTPSLNEITYVHDDSIF